MKRLFVLLLLANGVFFLWEKFVAPWEGAEESPVPRKSLDNIVLIKELPPVPEMVVAEPAAGAAVPPPEPEAAKPPPTVAPPPPKAMSASPPPLPSPPAQCLRIGPFVAETDGAALRRQAANLAEHTEVERNAVKMEKGYWVLSPTAPSFEAARAVKHKLMEQGAAETLILTEGEYANTVSLGFFKERAGAEKLWRIARTAGMDVAVKPRLAITETYWLKLRIKPGARFDAVWKSWQAGHPGAAATDIPCP